MKKRIKAFSAIFFVLLAFYTPAGFRADEEDYPNPYPYFNLAAFEELIGREIVEGLFPFYLGRNAVYIPRDFTYIDGERGMYVVFASFDEYGATLVAKHNVLDLVRCLETKAGFDGETPYEWESRSGRNIAPQRNRIYVLTVDDIRYGFSITTGSIETTDYIYRRTPPPISGADVTFGVTAQQGAVIGVGILLASGLVIVFLYFLDS